MHPYYFPKNRVIWPQMSIVLRLRRPALISLTCSCSARIAIIIAHLSAYPPRTQVPWRKRLWFG